MRWIRNAYKMGHLLTLYVASLSQQENYFAVTTLLPDDPSLLQSSTDWGRLADSVLAPPDFQQYPCSNRLLRPFSNRLLK